MIKVFDRLGGWLLAAIKVVFVPRATRHRMRESSAHAPTASAGEISTPRKALIAKAVSLHQQRQEVLSELDDETRKKLTSMARHMFPTVQPEKKRERKEHKPKSRA